MDNLCNNCIHKDICARRMATWGMKSCEHFKEERKGRWKYTLEGKYFQVGCTACGKIAIKADYSLCGDFEIDWPHCPNCGCDMRGKEDGCNTG